VAQYQGDTAPYHSRRLLEASYFVASPISRSRMINFQSGGDIEPSLASGEIDAKPWSSPASRNPRRLGSERFEDHEKDVVGCVKDWRRRGFEPAVGRPRNVVNSFD
jgi:hypothetical protein